MIGPLLRFLLTTYGPSAAKTLIAAVKKTLDSNLYIEAGHSPAKDLQDLINPIKGKKMTAQEAQKVLGLEKITPDTINAQYEKLYSINDPSKGGSFYLQCKLIGAKEALLNKNK